MLSEEKPNWKLVLEAKYGNVGRPTLSLGRIHKASLWWRDLVGLGVVRGMAGDWLNDVFVHRIGDGSDTSFWHYNWLSVGPLAMVFPRLFSISIQAEENINVMGNWVSGIWVWNLKWRRPFFAWEEVLYRDFITLLEGAPISLDKPAWCFRHGVDGLFSVKASYKFLSSWLVRPLFLPPSLSSVVYKVWDSWTPSKVVVFSWQTLLARIPTRANLAIRGMILEDVHLNCAVCGGEVETENHLFLLCPLAWSIWSEVYRWLGVVEVSPNNIASHFNGFLSSLKCGKKSLKGLRMVWHVVIWTLWRVRNEKIFSNKPILFEEVLDRIKCTSWKWLLARKPDSFCLFYEWCVDPLDCILR
jgi:hypothetical protein